MKKLIILSAILFSTTAFAGGNVLNLTPHNTLSLTPNSANNVLFNDVVALQIDKPKIHKDIKSIKKGKLTNKLEATDEFPTDDVLIDDNGDVVVITTDPREWKGIEEGGWLPELEPKCACIGIDHIPFDDLKIQHEFPNDDSSNNIIY